MKSTVLLRVDINDEEKLNARVLKRYTGGIGRVGLFGRGGMSLARSRK